jgi:hypothetical protein
MAMLEGDLTPGQTVRIDFRDGDFVFEQGEPVAA